MAKTTYLTLQQSEGFVIQAAAQIYAAYITTGQVVDGQEAEWMKRSIREAIQIAKTTDSIIIAEGEVG